MKNIYNVGMYIRLSLEDKKNQEESQSISNQRKVIMEYLKDKKEFKLIKEYVDDGVSGLTMNREGLNKLKEDLNNKIIDTIIVKDLSRIGRNYLEVGKMLEVELPMLNCRFISILDNYDSLNTLDTSSIMIPLKNLLNEAYSLDISNKVKLVLDNKRKQGLYVSPKAPLGYLKDPLNKYKLIIDEKYKYLIKKIYNLKLNGYSDTYIASKLNKENKYDITFYPQKIKRILTNPIYKGIISQHTKEKPSFKSNTIKNVPKEKHQLIIDKNLIIINPLVFDKINNLYYQIRVRAGKESYFKYQNKIYCNKCKNKMNKLNIYLKDKVEVYFKCSLCIDVKIKEKELDSLILPQIKKRLTEIEEYCLNPSKFVQDKEEKVQTLKKLKQKNLNSIKLVTNLDTQEKHFLLEKYQAQITKLDLQINHLLDSSFSPKNINLATIKKYQSLNKVTKKMILDLVHLIYIQDNQTILVEFIEDIIL